MNEEQERTNAGSPWQPAGSQPDLPPSSDGPASEPPTMEPQDVDQSPPLAAASSGHGNNSGLPGWIVYVALALVPAVIVGALVFFLMSGSDEDGVSFGVLDGFVRLTVSDGGDVETFVDQLPEGFPGDFPAPSGGKLASSFTIPSEDGTTYIVAYETSDSVETVYNNYLEVLDQDPFQLELSRAGEDFTGMQFSRPDSADFQGSVTITRSEVDGITGVFVFVLDVSQTAVNDSDFVPPVSRELPADFPEEVPIYQGQNATTITDTYFQRDAGVNSYLISFITKDADIDIINFYTKEFQDRGWTVEDAETEAGDFALMIDFEEDSSQELTGTIRADVLAADPSYTEVTMIVQVSATRGRGN